MGNKAYPSQETLQVTLDLGDDSIRKALRELEADGFIYPGERNDRTRGVTSTVWHVVDVVGERAALDAWVAQELALLRARRAAVAGDDVPAWGDGPDVDATNARIQGAREAFESAHPGAYATDGRALLILTGTKPEDVPVYRSFRANAAAKRQAKGRITAAAVERGVAAPHEFTETVVASLGPGAQQSKKAIDAFVNDGRLEEVLPAPSADRHLVAVPDLPDEPTHEPAGDVDAPARSGGAARRARLLARLHGVHSGQVGRLAAATGWSRAEAAETLAGCLVEWQDEHPDGTVDTAVAGMVDLILTPAA